MNDSRPDPDDDMDVGPARRSPSSTPRWVKLFLIIAAVLLTLLVAVNLLGGGGHGPSRHMPGGDAGVEMPGGDTGGPTP